MTIADDHATFAPDTYVPAQDHAETIDFVNSLNFAFDNWNLQQIFDAFTDDSVTDHLWRRIAGRAENTTFLESSDKPRTAGIRRVALNHIVDASNDASLTVMYLNVFMGVATTTDANLLAGQPMHDGAIGLPAIATGPSGAARPVWAARLRKGSL